MEWKACHVSFRDIPLWIASSCCLFGPKHNNEQRQTLCLHNLNFNWPASGAPDLQHSLLCCACRVENSAPNAVILQELSVTW